MARKLDAPTQLAGTAAQSGEIAHHGLGRDQLRRAALDHPFHGVVSSGIDTSTVYGLCRAYEPLLRVGQAFSHLTAAALWGAPLPDRGDRTLDVSTPRDHTRPRTAGVRGHRMAIDAELRFRYGFPVVAPAQTWCQIAAMVRSSDLVAVGDYLISGTRRPGGKRSSPLCSIVELERAIERHGSGRGARALAAALPRLRTGVDSRAESILRTMIVDAGFPEPVVGAAVHVEGGLVLHPDLAWTSLLLAIEYEGDGHRTTTRAFRDDILRKELLEAAGLRVVRVTADDLWGDRTSFLLRLARIYERRLRDVVSEESPPAVSRRTYRAT